MMLVASVPILREDLPDLFGALNLTLDLGQQHRPVCLDLVRPSSAEVHPADRASFPRTAVAAAEIPEVDSYRPTWHSFPCLLRSNSVPGREGRRHREDRRRREDRHRDCDYYQRRRNCRPD